VSLSFRRSLAPDRSGEAGVDGLGFALERDLEIVLEDCSSGPAPRIFHGSWRGRSGRPRTTSNRATATSPPRVVLLLLSISLSVGRLKRGALSDAFKRHGRSRPRQPRHARQQAREGIHTLEGVPVSNRATARSPYAIGIRGRFLSAKTERVFRLPKMASDIDGIRLFHGFTVVNPKYPRDRVSYGVL